MTVTDDQLLLLTSTHDIISVGTVADDRRRQLHGARTTFVRVASVSAESDGSAESSAAAGEIRIVGVPVSVVRAIERVRTVVAGAKGLPVSAYSLADLVQLAAADGATLRTILDELRQAGAELVGEAPFDRLADPQRAIEDVHAAGLTIARLTIDKLAASDPVPLLKSVAALQRSVGAIRAFAPLARSVGSGVPTTGYEDVRRVALARVIVDNIPSIQVDWSLYGPKLAQVALTMGADDIDGVSPDDDGALGPRRTPLAEVRRNIEAAGLEPVERNGRFDVLAR